MTEGREATARTSHVEDELGNPLPVYIASQGMVEPVSHNPHGHRDTFRIGTGAETVHAYGPDAFRPANLPILGGRQGARVIE